MKLLLTMALACGSLWAANCKAPPDVCIWNEARAQLVVMGDAEKVFVEAATDWAVVRNQELVTPGTVDAQALRKFTAMWIAWQNFLTEERKAQKLMHDFSVVEQNQQ